MQQRHGGQIGRHETAHGRLEQIARDRGTDARLLEPRCDGACVPLGSARRLIFQLASPSVSTASGLIFGS